MTPRMIFHTPQPDPSESARLTTSATWAHETWPFPAPTVDDGRERVAATTRLYSRTTERLVYIPGDMVPVDEMDALIADDDLKALHRAGKRADECPTPPHSSPSRTTRPSRVTPPPAPTL